MTKDPRDAIEIVGDVFEVPQNHCSAVLEGLEQAERGEYVSEDQMAALWKRCGLKGRPSG
jgi:predicted transcriptional regulator